MALPEYDSPKALKLFMVERGFAMQKKFGQNFLVSPSARAKIVSLVEVKAGQRIWEIGPGLGSLSSALMDSGAQLTVFEIDRGFIAILKDLFGARPGFRIVEGDFLKTWQAELAASGMPDSVCGNLPYNAAGAFMADFADCEFKPNKMVFTVQKEGAERMRAKFGSSNYSSFSVLCQSMYAIKSETELGPGCFWPAPDVTSTVISIRPRVDFPPLDDRPLFLRLTRSLFQSRRKTVQNNLKAAKIPDYAQALEEAGIDPGARAETLSPETIAALSNLLAKNPA
jgi:16S rRNA (adenine1518-N6/adenine1519-N6)-dimethyltransferase